MIAILTTLQKINKTFKHNHIGKKKIEILQKMDIFYIMEITLLKIE
jgi:hypothetical protein